MKYKFLLVFAVKFVITVAILTVNKENKKEGFHILNWNIKGADKTIIFLFRTVDFMSNYTKELEMNNVQIKCRRLSYRSAND